MKALRSQNV